MPRSTSPVSIICAHTALTRNNALATISPTAADSARYWVDWAWSWTTANHVRTFTSIAASALLTIAARTA